MATAKKKTEDKDVLKAGAISLVASALFFGGVFAYSHFASPDMYDGKLKAIAEIAGESTTTTPKYPPLDTALYDAKLMFLAHRTIATSTATTTASSTATSTATTTKRYLWPAKTVYPLDGAVLPFNRIVAYYGNFYSTKMGVLGEYPPDVVVQKLEDEVHKWNEADPNTPVIPAIHYIAAVAQGSAGDDGDWTARMPDSEIQKAITLGRQIHGIIFLDLQIGQSSVMKELNAVLPYMKEPDVHLGLDPEFAMQGNRKPGEYIGTMDAAQINEAINTLSKIVDEYNLPPKVLIIHRFTEDMVTNANMIHPTKEVQVVMNMDGWGTQTLKTGIYRQVITSEPVQFTGIKLFYKNDLKAPSTGMLTPQQILQFTPAPSYIQYQ